MPFDGVDAPRRPDPPKRAAPAETALIAMIAALALCLLLMPISLSSLIDLVRYLQGR